MVGEGRHLTRPTSKLSPMPKQIAVIHLYLLYLSMPDFRPVAGSIIMFSGSNNAMAAHYKNLIIDLCSTILSKYFSSETVISFENPSPHFPHHLPFLVRNNHITFLKHFSTVLLYYIKQCILVI